MSEYNGINEIYKLFSNEKRIEVIGENSGGFEAKVSSEHKEWVINIIENNNVRFDNPARLKSGHPYVLILPTDDKKLNL